MATHEYAHERRAMVTQQIRARGITAPQVLAAMAFVPRHCFVTPDLVGSAYADRPLPIGEGQTISQPYMVARMTALLELRATDRVLEIGAGSGYQTAVLAALCREVIAVERNQTLCDGARQRLDQLAIHNTKIFCQDGSIGLPSMAPYDAILVAAGSPRIPVALPNQLKDGGRLVCPVGSREAQQLQRVIRKGGGFSTTSHTDCIFVPLVGEDGWPAY